MHSHVRNTCDNMSNETQPQYSVLSTPYFSWQSGIITLDQKSESLSVTGDCGPVPVPRITFYFPDSPWTVY